MNIAVILAAGKSERLNLNKNKCFVKVCNLYVYEYSLNTFFSNPNIDLIILVADKENIKLVNNEKYPNKLHVIEGGNNRQESVFRALNYLLKNNLAQDDDNILIHDGARPLVSDEIINNNIFFLKNHDFTTTCLMSVDSLVRVNEYFTTKIVDRDAVFLEQTPLGGKFKLLYNIHSNSINEFVLDTHDDVSLILRYGYKAFMVRGNKMNFKITYEEDLKLFRLYLKILKK